MPLKYACRYFWAGASRTFSPCTRQCALRPPGTFEGSVPLEQQRLYMATYGSMPFVNIQVDVKSVPIWLLQDVEFGARWPRPCTHSGEFISQITLPIRCVTNLRNV